MKASALLAACAVTISVLLAGCGGGGSGCNNRTQGCDHPTGPAGGVSDMGQPYEDQRNSNYLNDQANTYDQQQRQHDENLQQEGYQQGYDQGYQDGQDAASRNDDEGGSVDNSGSQKEWYYNVPPSVLNNSPGPG